MSAFRAISGDTNPIHQNVDYPLLCGFEGPIVYGGILVARLSGLLGSYLPGRGCIWRSFQLRFRSPLYVNEPARLRAVVTHSNEDLGLYEIEFAIKAKGRRVAEGQASTMLAKEGIHAG